MKAPTSEMYIAMFWADHIIYPCTIEVEGKIENMRQSYINEVKRKVIPKLTNPFAKKYLEDLIKDYE